MNTPTSTPQPTPGGRLWAYAGTVLGAFTSVAANIADAYVTPKDWQPARPGQEWVPDIGAVMSAVFWPLALLAASETLARKRWANPVTRRVGIAAVLVVATAAAVISYQHMYALLQHYQESDLSATIGPLAIDGLMIVCSLALVAKDTLKDTGQDIGQGTTGQHDAGQPSGSSPTPGPGPTARPDTPPAGTPRRTARTRTAKPTGAGKPAGAAPDTAARVAELRAKHPDLTQKAIAAHLGMDVRTLRRHLNTPTDVTADDPTGSQDTPGAPTTLPDADDESQAA